MEQLYEDEILKKLNNIQGLSNNKKTIMQYARYINLCKTGDIKDVGNANMLIDCPENYTDRHKLINLILDVLDTDVHYLTKRELTSDMLFSKIESDVIVLDTLELQTTLKFNIADLRYRVNINKDKVFIVVTDNFDKKALSYIIDLFSWHLEITSSSVEDKQNYIVNKLNENDSSLSKDCNSILNLASDEMPVIETTLLNMIVDCKLNNITIVDDTLLNKHYLSIDDDVDKDVTNTAGTKTALQQLDELIGLNDIKKQIHQIVNYVKVNKHRGKMPMLHMCFEGPSGSGKNEIARLVGRIFKEENILQQGQFVEVSRADLIAAYIGQTASKTQDVINKAKGGVLFIDEAYSLDPKESGKDYGSECISTLIKAMEDNRNNLCVILAGYTEDMQQLLKANRGFLSRIQFELQFPDYTSDELYQIFKKMAKADGYKLSNNIKPVLLDHFEKARQKEDFGNGRYARNILDKVTMEQAQRVATDTTADKDLIKLSDIRNVLDNLNSAEPVKRQIGFAI